MEREKTAPNSSLSLWERARVRASGLTEYQIL